MRGVLSKLQLGEADAGVLYATDLAGSTRLQQIEIPTHLNVAATYTIAVVEDSPAARPGRSVHRLFLLRGGRCTAAFTRIFDRVPARRPSTCRGAGSVGGGSPWPTGEAAQAMGRPRRRRPVGPVRTCPSRGGRTSRSSGQPPPMVLFLLLPLLALVLRTDLGEVPNSLAQPAARRAILLSLWTSATASTLTVLFGTPLALLMARRRFREPPGAGYVDRSADRATAGGGRVSPS